MTTPHPANMLAHAAMLEDLPLPRPSTIDFSRPATAEDHDGEILAAESNATPAEPPPGALKTIHAEYLAAYLDDIFQHATPGATVHLTTLYADAIADLGMDFVAVAAPTREAFLDLAAPVFGRYRLTPHGAAFTIPPL